MGFSLWNCVYSYPWFHLHHQCEKSVECNISTLWLRTTVQAITEDNSSSYWCAAKELCICETAAATTRHRCPVCQGCVHAICGEICEDATILHHSTCYKCSLRVFGILSLVLKRMIFTLMARTKNELHCHQFSINRWWWKMLPQLLATWTQPSCELIKSRSVESSSRK